MENIYEKRFSESLKKYVEEKSSSEGKGFISKLAKTLKTSQGQLSNVLRGERPGTESWRRFVADTINIEYDVMIGLKIKNNKPNDQNGKVYEFPTPYKQPPPKRIVDMHKNLDDIFESNDEGLIGAIEANLKSFKEIAELKKTVKEQKETIDGQNKELKSVSERLSALEANGG